MSKHTPGPWTAEQIVSSRPLLTIYSGDTMIADDVAPQNASLIAAAPDLRDALQALLAEVDAMTARVGWAGNGGRDKARTALAKAGVKS